MESGYFPGLTVTKVDPENRRHSYSDSVFDVVVQKLDRSLRAKLARDAVELAVEHRREYQLSWTYCYVREMQELVPTFLSLHFATKTIEEVDDEPWDALVRYAAGAITFPLGDGARIGRKLYRLDWPHGHKAQKFKIKLKPKR